MRITFNAEKRTIKIQDRSKRTFIMMGVIFFLLSLQLFQNLYHIYVHSFVKTPVYLIVIQVFVFLFFFTTFFTRSYKESICIDDVVSIKFRKLFGKRGCTFKLKNGKSRLVYKPLFEVECDRIKAEAEKYGIPVSGI